jgi:Flp pilus assembly protein TadD
MNPPPPAKLLLLIAVVVVSITGCSQHASSPYTTPSSADRNSLKAQELTQRAVDLMESDPDEAEKLLREALGADAWHGPAHNDLGVIYLQRGQLYEAANEFEWARKLMPGHPDPRMNLALTLEKAGRIDEALCTYETALEVHAGHIPTMQAMTRLQVRHNRVDDQTKKMLTEISLSGESEQWRSWAQKQMIRLNPGVQS